MSYRHPRYHTQDGPTGVYAVLAFALSLPAVVIILGTAIKAANSAPIVRKGQFCPMQYYRIGEYCAPSTRKTPSAVRIVDETCPIGTYTQSDYCIIPSNHLPH